MENEKTSVTVLDKGPIIVDGKLTVNYNGVVEEKEGKVALCRCGYSQKKPSVMVHINPVLL